jgi:hypothetical protein
MDETLLVEKLEARAKRGEGRRDFFRTMGIAAFTAGGLVAAGGFSALQAQSAPTDVDVFNFALNLEYLEATYYSRAVFGTDLDAAQTTGTGATGAPLLTGARQVTFTDASVAALAREIATNERLHVQFVRQQLGTNAIARPVLDLSVTPTSAFSNAARSAGLIGPGQSFDPYASDEAFLQAAFLFEDVGVTAYKGSSTLITSPVFLEAAAGILAVEGYHASIARTLLYAKGIQTPALGLIEATEAISNARDSLDGPDDRDQGVRPSGGTAPVGNVSNIVPADGNAIAFSRTAGQVLNIAYLNRAAVTAGGFFPNGVNGNIRTSANNA